MKLSMKNVKLAFIGTALLLGVISQGYAQRAEQDLTEKSPVELLMQDNDKVAKQHTVYGKSIIHNDYMDMFNQAREYLEVLDENDPIRKNGLEILDKTLETLSKDKFYITKEKDKFQPKEADNQYIEMHWNAYNFKDMKQIFNLVSESDVVMGNHYLLINGDNQDPKLYAIVDDLRTTIQKIGEVTEYLMLQDTRKSDYQGALQLHRDEVGEVYHSTTVGSLKSFAKNITHIMPEREIDVSGYYSIEYGGASKIDTLKNNN